MIWAERWQGLWCGRKDRGRVDRAQEGGRSPDMLGGPGSPRSLVEPPVSSNKL